MKARILVVVFYFLSIVLYAQNDVNAYRYIIVPKKFDFQKTPDKYQLNSLTKFLFNKEGFMAVMEGDQIPNDLFSNPCLALKVNLNDSSGMLSTKLTIELLDCRSNRIFTSIEGKSRVKDYKRGYQEALRKAFQSVKSLNYRYDPNLVTAQRTVELIDKKEVNLAIEDGQTDVGVTTDGKEEESMHKVSDQTAEEVVEKPKDEVLQVNPTVVENKESEGAILYAQVKPFGYQLVDSTPSVVYLLQKTSRPDTYILKNKNGIVYKKNETWMAEYYEEGVLVQKELKIKF